MQRGRQEISVILQTLANLSMPAQILATFPEKFHPRATRDYLDCAIRTVIQLHILEPPGDILVFLTGQAEIEQACYAIECENAKFRDNDDVGVLKALTLYSSLPPAQQRRVLIQLQAQQGQAVLQDVR